MSGVASPSPRRRSMRRRVLLGVGAITVLAVAAYAPWLWITARSNGRIHTAADAPTQPVTLVLGAGLTSAGTPTPYLAARLDVARDLLAAGRTQVVIVSGDNRVANYDEPTAMRDYLVAHGVPEWRIVRDFAGRDTYDSCSRARRIFGVDSLLVVSQGYHLPRAVATCLALGLDAEGVGDWTGEQYAATWQQGALRERAAAWKTVVDLVTGRDPVLGQQETAVSDALARAASSSP